MSQQVPVYRKIAMRDESFIEFAAADRQTTTRTAGALFSAGNSSSPVTTATANTRFFDINVQNSATSGDNRGMYLRLYMTGAGGGGESLRAFTTVNNVAAGTAHGAHISLNFNTTGSLTGLGVAARATLHIANQNWGSVGGTCAAVQAEIYSDGANSDPVGMTELSFIRCVNDGNASGIADVDDDAFLLTYTGGTTASGNVIESSVTEANYAYSARCKINGTTAYLMFASAVG